MLLILLLTLCGLTSQKTNQGGPGLSGSVHEEAHPCVINAHANRGMDRPILLQSDNNTQGRNHVLKVWGPIRWSRLLYRTKYGCYTQFRALLSVT